jgi:electron transfer flavoprotein alpha subunit
MKKTHDVFVYIQLNKNGVHPSSLSIIGEALRLTDSAHGIAVVGEAPESMLDALAGSGLKAVYLYCREDLGLFEVAPYAAAITECLKEYAPTVFLLAATFEGRALAPAVAAALKTGSAADCAALKLGSDGELLQTRPAFDGNVIADVITPHARPQIATAHTGSILPYSPSGRKTKILRKDAGIIPPPLYKYPSEFADVGDAAVKDVIIAIGGGIRDKSDIAIFKRLCDAYDASLMCTRVIVERGWMPQSAQIGLSGLTVTPRLLITFGISGSAQFISGVVNPARLCAVNTDADAPIMYVADTPIVGDLYEIAAKIKALPRHGNKKNL